MDTNLLERVERLERRCKILFGLLVLLAVAFGLVLYHEFKNASDLTPPEAFVANPPVLKSPGKLIYDSIEVDKLIAHTIEVTGGDIEIDYENGKYGKNSVSLEATRDGWVDLSLRDCNGDQKAILLLTPSGKPTLSILDQNNVTRLFLGVTNVIEGEGLTKEEEYSLKLRDANNKVIWHPSVKNPLQ